MKYKGIKKLYYSISEISEMLGIKQSVIRYWESEFKELKPQKNRAGNRIYKKDDISILRMIHHYVHEKHLSIHEANEVITDLKKEGLYKRKLVELSKVEPKPSPVEEEPKSPEGPEIIEESVVISTEEVTMPVEGVEEETKNPEFEIVTPTQETFIYPLDEVTKEEPEPVSEPIIEPEPEIIPEPVVEEPKSDPELKELLKKISSNIKDIIDILNE